MCHLSDCFVLQVVISGMIFVVVVVVVVVVR